MLRDGNRRAFGRSSGGVPPNFWAAFNDAGAGAVSLALTAGTGSATFTRATTAWTKLSTGLWAQVGTGVARSCYLGANTAVGAYGGYLAEAAATNLCLQSRDLSTTWTALNATLLKDQIGIDGVTNSASSMTATLANGSALQTITEAATASALSMFIKRVTGVGTVTIQQGASTSEISGSLNSSTYTRVELDATVLNPAIGIVLGTNGDKIAVDMVQFENTALKATSPIPTTTVAVTRNADILTYPTSGNVLGTIGTSSAQVVTLASTGAIWLGTYSPSGIMLELSSGAVAMYDGTGTVTGQTFTGSITSIQKVASRWNTTAGKTYVAGSGTATGALDGDLSLGANFSVGSGLIGTFPTNGMMQNVKLWTVALSDAQIASL